MCDPWWPVRARRPLGRRLLSGRVNTVQRLPLRHGLWRTPLAGHRYADWRGRLYPGLGPAYRCRFGDGYAASVLIPPCSAALADVRLGLQGRVVLERHMYQENDAMPSVAYAITNGIRMA